MHTIPCAGRGAASTGACETSGRPCDPTFPVAGDHVPQYLWPPAPPGRRALCPAEARPRAPLALSEPWVARGVAPTPAPLGLGRPPSPPLPPAEMGRSVGVKPCAGCAGALYGSAALSESHESRRRGRVGAADVGECAHQSRPELLDLHIGELTLCSNSLQRIARCQRQRHRPSTHDRGCVGMSGNPTPQGQ
jgi:hypothetical protein